MHSGTCTQKEQGMPFAPCWLDCRGGTGEPFGTMCTRDGRATRKSAMIDGHCLYLEV